MVLRGMVSKRWLLVVLVSVVLGEARAVEPGDPSATVVAAYDIGPEERDAIPTDRALRAAQWAVALVKDSAVKTGPIYKRHRVEGSASNSTTSAKA